jgi:hypothetical protein
MRNNAILAALFIRLRQAKQPGNTGHYLDFGKKNRQADLNDWISVISAQQAPYLPD